MDFSSLAPRQAIRRKGHRQVLHFSLEVTHVTAARGWTLAIKRQGGWDVRGAMDCLVSLATGHRQVLPTPAAAQSEVGGGGLGAESANLSLLSHPSPGLWQLLSCHLIDKTLGRPLSPLWWGFYLTHTD